jgi:cellulose synthase operon protein YhjQ
MDRGDARQHKDGTLSVIAVLGAAGGAGATTVTAHLATAIARQDKTVLCFDFCPDNVLRLHFGAALTDRDGFAAALVAQTPWQYAAYTGASGVRFLPFGMLQDDAALDQLSDWLRLRPLWFRDLVESIDLPRDAIIVCDCPRLPAALRNQVLAAADLSLVTCAPDPLSLASATGIAGQLRHRDGTPGAVLFNGFEAARALDRDMQLLLRRRAGHLAAPVVIHRDESLREALAHKLTVFDYAPASQAAQEFAALATWAIVRCGQTDAQGERA